MPVIAEARHVLTPDQIKVLIQENSGASSNPEHPEIVLATGSFVKALKAALELQRRRGQNPWLFLGQEHDHLSFQTWINSHIHNGNGSIPESMEIHLGQLDGHRVTAQRCYGEPDDNNDPVRIAKAKAVATAAKIRSSGEPTPAVLATVDNIVTVKNNQAMFALGKMDHAHELYALVAAEAITADVYLTQVRQYIDRLEVLFRSANRITTQTGVCVLRPSDNKTETALFTVDLDPTTLLEALTSDITSFDPFSAGGSITQQSSHFRQMQPDEVWKQVMTMSAFPPDTFEMLNQLLNY